MGKTQKNPKKQAKPKAKATIEWETQCGYPKLWVAGCDEVGRGCLAGPVVAAAVVLPASFFASALEKAGDSLSWLSQVGDSKALSAELRDELAPKIKQWAQAWAIGVASVEEIDRINILKASHLAMIRALQGLTTQPDHLLVDGKLLPDLRDLKRPLDHPLKATAIVKGDALCLSIAAASVIAKVYRDDLMVKLESEFPGYGLSIHKGYPTPKHTEALKRLGVTSIHRRTFGPVAALLHS